MHTKPGIGLAAPKYAYFGAPAGPEYAFWAAPAPDPKYAFSQHILALGAGPPKMHTKPGVGLEPPPRPQNMHFP